VHVADANAHHAQATAGTLISLSGQQVSLANGSAQYQIPVTGATPFTPVYTALSSFAGSGLAFSAGFNVGAGTLITVNSNDVAVANGTAQYQVPVTGATPFAPAYTALSSFAGNGLTFGSSFAVGVANTGAAGLSIEADAVRLTSSSAPGAAASILASDATGKLTLPLFVATSSVTTPSLITASGDLSVTPAGSNIAIANSKTIQSNYVSGWAGSGYRIDSNVSVASQSFAEFDNLSVRGTLSVYELVINQIRATNGTLIVSSAGKIDSVSGGNWTFEDPNSSNLCPFAVDDLVIIQEVDVNASTLVKRIVRRVSVVTGKTITTVAATGGPADTGAAAAGDTVVRIGNVTNVARRGSVLITSDMSNSPYTDTISGVTSWADWTGGTKTRVRMGHLSGITGTANEYGIIAGTGYTSSDSYAKFSTSGVVQNNVESDWRASGTTYLSINATSGIDIVAPSSTIDKQAYTFSESSTVMGGMYGYYNSGTTEDSLSIYLRRLAKNQSIRIDTNSTATSNIVIYASGSAQFAQWNLTAGATSSINGRAQTVSVLNNTTFQTGGTTSVVFGNVLDADTTEFMIGAAKLQIGSLSSNPSNISLFSGQRNASSSISLTNTAWSNGAAIGFNAYHVSDAVSPVASGAWKFLGTQYTGNVTRPGLQFWDGNSGVLAWYYGEAGLASGADVTTWTKIFEAGANGFKVTGNIGFYGTAPIAKPTVSGSRGGNAALASLLTALANYGLIVNSTT